MVKDLTLSNKKEINFANVLKNNGNNFDFISSLHNLLANILNKSFGKEVVFFNQTTIENSSHNGFSIYGL